MAGGAVALAAGLRTSPRDPIARPLMWLAVLGAVFAAPLVADAILRPPGNLVRILEVARESAGRHPWGDAMAFTAWFWLWLPAPAIMAAVLPFAGRSSARTSAPPLRPLTLVAGTETLVMLAYARHAPGDLYGYIATFYLAVPLLVLIVVAAWGLSGSRNGRAVLLTALCLVLTIGHLRPAEREAPWLRGFTQAIASQATAPVSLAFRDTDYYGNLWSFHAGLLVDLARHRVDACIAAPAYAFLFTPQRLCDGQPRIRYSLIPAHACHGLCLAEAEGVGLRRLPDSHAPVRPERLSLPLWLGAVSDQVGTAPDFQPSPGALRAWPPPQWRLVRFPTRLENALRRGPIR